MKRLTFGSPRFPTSRLLKGSWDLVSKVISTLIGVISIVTLCITLVSKSHDPLSTLNCNGYVAEHYL